MKLSPHFDVSPIYRSTTYTKVKGLWLRFTIFKGIFNSVYRIKNTKVASIFTKYTSAASVSLSLTLLKLNLVQIFYNNVYLL